MNVRVIEFLWDEDALAAELDTKRGARVHVPEHGTLVSMLQAEQGEVFAVVCDHLGMPKELLGQDGRVVGTAAHSTWGRVVDVKRRGPAPGARPVESPFRLLGQYADDETGLCHTRFRYFKAATGRWLSPDPLGIAGGRNLLAFDGAPTADVDPLGLECLRRVGPRLVSRQGPEEMSRSQVDKLAKRMKKFGYDESHPIDAAEVDGNS
jgi:RHS repeat-associated protein